MEHFLEGIALLRHWYINPNEKSNKYKSSLLSQLAKALTEHLLLQGNVPLRHLLNSKPQFISWQNEVNDWALSLLRTNSDISSNFTILWIFRALVVSRYGFLILRKRLDMTASIIAPLVKCSSWVLIFLYKISWIFG